MRYIVKSQLEFTTSTGVKFVFANPSADQMEECFYYEDPTLKTIIDGTNDNRKYIQKPLELGAMICKRIENCEAEIEEHIAGKAEPVLKEKKIETWADFMAYDFSRERAEVSRYLLNLQSVVDKKK